MVGVVRQTLYKVLEEEPMNEALKQVAVVLISAGITLVLCGAAWLGMERLAASQGTEVATEAYQGPGEAQAAPERGEQGEQDASDVDRYRAWVESATGMQVEEDRADDMALAICASLDSGSTMGDLFDIHYEGGFSTDEASAFIVGAVHIYCPAHQGVIDAFMAGESGGDGENGGIEDMGMQV